MKRIIAVLLALSICFSVLPAAFAANIGHTTEGLRKGKVVFHIDDDIAGYRQLLVEALDEAMASFASREFYFSGVWKEAQQLYKNECDRIYSLADINDLVQDGFSGPSANDTTMEVSETLYALSELNKTVIKKASDLEKLKNQLKADVSSDISLYFKKGDYSDFYWDKLVQVKAKAFKEINAVSCFAEAAAAKSKWEDYFEEYSIDDEEAEPEEFLFKEFLSKEEMSLLINALGNGLYEALSQLEEKGYKKAVVYSDDVYLAIDAFYNAAERAQYAEAVLRLYEDTVAKIEKLIGVKPEAEKPSATISYKKRMLKKVNTLFYSYTKSDYSESAWTKLEDIRFEAENTIVEAQYQYEIGDKYLDSVKKQMKAVQNYAAELKDAKKVAVIALKEYLGNKKYQQTKVKKLVADGTKKINAAKVLEDVYSLCDKYTAALEKTVNMYKITVSKSGKGSVTKTANVKYGKNFTVKIVPAAGYKIKSIVVDGKKVKLTNAFTFKKVVRAHTIKVTFGK